MDQSEEDKAQLAELAQRRDRGEISEKQYQQLLWDRLKRTRKNTGSITAQHLSMLDTRDGAPNVELEGIPQLPTSSAVAPSPVSSPALSLSDSLTDSLAGLSGTGHKSNLRRPGSRYNRRKNTIANLFVFSGVFVLGVGLAVVIGLLKRPTPVESGIIQPTPEPSAAAEPTPPEEISAAKAAFIEPMFGPLAISQCRERCAAISDRSLQPACVRSCRRLSLGHFGRRILIEDQSAADVGRILVNRCTKKPLDVSPHYSGASWEKSANQALSALQRAASVSKVGDIGGQRQYFQQLVDANRNLKMPPGGTADEVAVTELLLRATCLRAQLLLTEMGISTAQQDTDEFSKRFYTGVKNVVVPQTVDYEGQVFSKASALSLAGY